MDFTELAKEYGLGFAIGALLTPWLYSVDKRSRRNQGEIESVHDRCHIPQGAMEEMQEQIKDLQEEDHDINSRLSVLESTVNRIDENVSQVLMHLTKKGIDGGN